MKRLTIVIAFIALLLIAGCGKDQVTCNRPYILVGEDCCLDQNDNAVCDKEESNSPEVLPSPEGAQIIEEEMVDDVVEGVTGEEPVQPERTLSITDFSGPVTYENKQAYLIKFMVYEGNNEADLNLLCKEAGANVCSGLLEIQDANVYRNFAMYDVYKGVPLFAVIEPSMEFKKIEGLQGTHTVRLTLKSVKKGLDLVEQKEIDFSTLS